MRWCARWSTPVPSPARPAPPWTGTTAKSSADSRAGTAPALLEALRSDLAAIPAARLGVVQGRKHFCDRSGDLAVSRTAAHALTGKTRLDPFRDELLQQHLDAGQSEATFGARLHDGGRTMLPGEPVLLTSNRAARARQIGAVLSETQPLYTILDLGSLAGQEIATQQVFFPQPARTRGLAFELLRHRIASARIAEKCKFPHVTHFFNGFDPAVEGDGTCIHSIPEDQIPQRPEMSSAEITDRIIAAMREPGRRAIVANIANLDQVGHIGDLTLCERAASTVDGCYRRLVDAASQHGFTLMVTADHGNADVMTDEHGRPFGSHTDYPVPFLIQPAPGMRLDWRQKDGALANVAATFLGALGVQAPDWMAPPLAALRSR